MSLKLNKAMLALNSTKFVMDISVPVIPHRRMTSQSNCF